MYEKIYEYSDGIIHLGESSEKKFESRFRRRGRQNHAVIPHGNYSCFPDGVTKSEAREKLGIQRNEVVSLAFGALRGFDEVELLFNGFNNWRQDHKKLIVAGRIPWPEHRNREWLFIQWNTLLRNMELHEGWIPDDEVQVYLNAADVLIIPRIESLNSGNVALGFTFGCVVVGPETGVIGEQLRKTGNPTFDPDAPHSLATALDEAMTLADNDHGDQNREVAERQRNWSRVVEQHVHFYRHVRKTESSASTSQ